MAKGSSSGVFVGGLYPTVAFSDAFNAAGHFYGALLCFEKGERLAGCGLMTVALAAFVGVLRFGFSESMFAGANGHLADVAAFVGLPLVGLAYLSRCSGALPLTLWELFASYDRTSVILGLVCVEALTRDAKMRDLFKILLNLAFFVGPCLWASTQQLGKHDGAIGVVIFALAGVIITAEREKYIAGVRCENWFHYAIGFAAVLVAKGLF
jgi:hypothetical protein